MAKTKKVKTALKTPMKKRIIIGVISGVGVLALSGAGYAFYYSNRVLPRVSVAGVALGGLSLPDAVVRLQTAGDDLVAQPFSIQVSDRGDKKLDVHPVDINLILDPQASAAEAYSYGRSNDFLTSLRDYAHTAVTSSTLDFHLTYDEAKLGAVVDAFAADVDTPELNAGVKIVDGKVVETQGVNGKRIDKSFVKAAILNHWQTGATAQFVAVRSESVPKIATGQTATVATQATAIRQLKFVLTSGTDTTTPKQVTIDSWITSELTPAGSLQVALNKDSVSQWLQKVAPSINKDAAEARLTLQDGKVTVFQAGQDGTVLDVDKTASAFLDTVRDYVAQSKTDHTVTIPAIVTTTHPHVTDQTVTNLGVGDLIGSGTTSFSTSPQNRIHNINVGATALNGILIAPGAEFSTLKYLGSIDSAAGYLPELVIKENHTVPDFGGGLCQVSTTLFRAAMNSGLKITERRNHSYRVSYYEPPVGKDATIFEGGPDFKFVNDTAANILVQSHVEGTKITFDIYGTKDGRTNEQSAPVVSDVTPPPDPLYENTDTLDEGVTKQTDHAHPGANAAFTYTVYNADHSVRNKQVFVSHYVPWQARFLVGTKHVDPPADQPPAQ